VALDSSAARETVIMGQAVRLITVLQVVAELAAWEVVVALAAMAEAVSVLYMS
jgi:hypothetical protein